MNTFFISDLHLCNERPQTTALFNQFLGDIAGSAKALYILGDLFEYWLGDDQLDHDPLAQAIARSLSAVSHAGTRVHFMHGNRDFLIGERFCREAGLNLLDDPTSIAVDGKSLLLMHGDTLCTDDVAYQEFRHQVRDPSWQAAILAKPYAEREALARTIRSRSDVEKSMKADAIMDVNDGTVAATLQTHSYPTLIHGHTHRPAHHEHLVDGHRCERWVLADWHDTGAALVHSPAGFAVHTISAP
ncbi:MAG: UDP-2,3-diacylglucosamine diphosphatase [Betaproteobacteria bacterium]|nr:UDP-2,3-diacylglucosamine diphosphatase [Betaproteobacteria bacterium]